MADDYKDEFLLRLQKSAIYTALSDKCVKKDPEVMTLIDSAVSYAFQRTKTILRHMGEFTLHDSDHLFRVLNLMEKTPTRTDNQKLIITRIDAFNLKCFFP